MFFELYIIKTYYSRGQVFIFHITIVLLLLLESNMEYEDLTPCLFLLNAQMLIKNWAAPYVYFIDR